MAVRRPFSTSRSHAGHCNAQSGSTKELTTVYDPIYNVLNNFNANKGNKGKYMSERKGTVHCNQCLSHTQCVFFFSKLNWTVAVFVEINV